MRWCHSATALIPVPRLAATLHMLAMPSTRRYPNICGLRNPPSCPLPTASGSQPSQQQQPPPSLLPPPTASSPTGTRSSFNHRVLVGRSTTWNGTRFFEKVCDFLKMADVSMMGASLDKCAMAFVDRTRQLKSLVLLRSSGPSEQTDQVKLWQIIFRSEELIDHQHAHLSPRSLVCAPLVQKGCARTLSDCACAAFSDPGGTRGCARKGREDDVPTKVKDRRGDPGCQAMHSAPRLLPRTCQR